MQPKQLHLPGIEPGNSQKIATPNIIDKLTERPPLDLSLPKFVSYGGGKNSTAMLIWMYVNNLIPDAILFADTGGEKPETYAYIKVINEWCVTGNFPEITIVKANSKHGTLEQECLNSNVLPSKAYGRSQCSLKWKVQPQKVFINKWKKQHGFKKHIEFVGYHYGELRRLINKDGYLKPTEDDKHRVECPLVVNKIDEAGCLQLIAAAGLPLPQKSACFFCPSSKPSEIRQLKETHPDLYERSIAIERAGMTTARKVKGLGRKLNWESMFQLTPLEIAAMEYEQVNRSCSCID